MTAQLHASPLPTVKAELLATRAGIGDIALEVGSAVGDEVAARLAALRLQVLQ